MTTRTFKALSIVTNVKQGELIKQLIKENEEIKSLRHQINKMGKYIDDMCEERENGAMYCCRMCNEKWMWLELDKNYCCENCEFDINNRFNDWKPYKPVHDPEGEVYEDLLHNLGSVEAAKEWRTAHNHAWW